MVTQIQSAKHGICSAWAQW